MLVHIIVCCKVHVAELDGFLVGLNDQWQNWTIAALHDHGIRPSLYRSIAKSCVVQRLVARLPGPRKCLQEIEK